MWADGAGCSNIGLLIYVALVARWPSLLADR